MSGLTERLRVWADRPADEISLPGFKNRPVKVGIDDEGRRLLCEAAAALETLEWFAENAYSLKDRERAQKALGL